MQELTLQNFFRYFKDLKEYVDLSAMSTNITDFNEADMLKMKERIKLLAAELKLFRKQVYDELSKQPELSQTIGTSTRYFCANKKCKEQYQYVKHPLFNHTYKCSKCGTLLLE